MRSSTERLNPGRPTGAWLLQQHRLFIARHARRLGRGVAEDLASEAIVRSLRHPAPDGHHGPWLERVFRNLLVDHLRRSARGQRAGDIADDTAYRSDSPEQRAAEAQLRRRLVALWPELRPEWQQALASSFGEDPAAAPANADLSPITLRTRTFRALGMLRRALGVARGWVPLPTPLSLSGQLQPLAAALLPGAIAVTALVSPAAPVEPRVTAPPALAQVVERRTAPPPRPPVASPAAPVRPPARARPPASPAPAAPADPTRAVQRYDFDDDDISGDLQRPDGVDVTGAPGHARHRSLIEIRGSFTAELVRTFEDL
jgi:DNA-directed RNA polymerase specialized sigma24 family protein